MSLISIAHTDSRLIWIPLDGPYLATEFLSQKIHRKSLQILWISRDGEPALIWGAPNWKSKLRELSHMPGTEELKRSELSQFLLILFRSWKPESQLALTCSIPKSVPTKPIPQSVPRLPHLKSQCSMNKNTVVVLQNLNTLLRCPFRFRAFKNFHFFYRFQILERGRLPRGADPRSRSVAAAGSKKRLASGPRSWAEAWS